MRVLSITFDAPQATRQRYLQVVRPGSNVPLPGHVYDAVDQRLRTLGTKDKSSYQVRLLRTNLLARDVMAALRPLLRGAGIMICEVSGRVQGLTWSIVHPDKPRQTKVASWLRGQHYTGPSD